MKRTTDVKIHPLAERLPAMSEAEFNALVESIRVHGQDEPIMLLNGAILDGRHRYRACLQLGITPKFATFNPKRGNPVEYVAARATHRSMTEAQRACVAERFMDDLAKSRKLGRPSENERQSGRISGKSSEYAALRFGVSARNVERVRSIRKQSLSLYEKLFAGRLSIGQAANQARHLAGEAKIKRLRRTAAANAGDRRKLIIGDCLDVMESMQPASVRCVFADLPYNIGWTYDGDSSGDRLPQERFIAHWRERIAAAARLLTDDGSIFILINDENSDLTGLAMRELGLHRRPMIVWWEHFPMYKQAELPEAARFIHYFTKSPKALLNDVESRVPSVRKLSGDRRANPAGRLPDNVWQVARVVGNRTDAIPYADAPPQLPVEIPERCILLATEPGDTVLDFCAGNGTTGVAALRNERRFIGIEKSAKYARQAEQWIAAQITQGKGAAA